MGRRSTTSAAALAAGLLIALTGCGGSGEAAPASSGDVLLEDEALDSMVSQVKKMGIIEWEGQLLTTNPDNGGKRIFALDGRYSPSTGYSELSMDSDIGGRSQQVDYLVVNGRTYFNSDDWGPGASTCWADITGDRERSWALPTDLDPSWPVLSARAIRLAGDGVVAGVPAPQVLTGMPRGLFPDVPAFLDDVEAKAQVSSHGPLVVVGVDVKNMWNDVDATDLSGLDTQKAGWWSMTMKESNDDSSIRPPERIFDPAVTPPRQCKRRS